MKQIIIIISLSILSFPSFGQCTTQGQRPETAFPVCATDVFHQKDVPACTNAEVPVPGCEFDQITYADQSPFWYKFTCFESGTLGFLIKPVNPSDDYDWQLFDITGHDPKDVYTNPSLVVTGNWSGEHGNTGASSKGTSNMVCATLPNAPRRPLFSQMPEIKEGHTYLLLVSHYSGTTQSGYDLSFGGGSAAITDTTAPKIDKVVPDCDGKKMTVYLNKYMECGSLSLDGSDFKINGTSIQIESAKGKGCSTGFEMNQLELKLDAPLSPGKYTLEAQNGKDGNTLLDICGVAVPVGNKVAFEKEKVLPVAMDNVKNPGCEPKSVTVVFGGMVLNHSIATDGSDFEIKNENTGTSLNIISAEPIEKNNDKGTAFQINLDQPIYKKGTYKLILQKGSDGNTAISECGVASVAGQELSFQSFDTVRAAIIPKLNYTCNEVEIELSNPGGDGINTWIWSSDTGQIGNTASISYLDTTFKMSTINLKVSNGVCSDERTKKLVFNQDYHIHADFSIPSFVCPQDQVTFKNKSEGTGITKREWTFGNGEISYLKQPRSQHYPSQMFTKNYKVKLTIANNNGCKDTAVREIKVINTCEVYVPSAFSPNDDGQNDFLQPLNAFVAKDLVFRIYNRYGKLIFQTEDWTKGWDGKYKGKPQPVGSYVWTLNFINTKTGEKVARKGATLLIR